jgi:iron complex outermembrane recepter protein
VRTPSEAESDVRLNPAPPVPIPPGLLTILGDGDFDSEKLVAYELGYRIQPINQLTLDLTGFYNVYDDLRSLELAIVGRNLFDDHHPEFAPTFVGTQKSEVERSVYGTVVWRY